MCCLANSRWKERPASTSPPSWPPLATRWRAGTIDIPRVLVTPIGKVESGFNTFTVELKAFNYQALTEELWIQHLRTHQTEVVALGDRGIREHRLENYLVRGLMDFDDVSYDQQADLLYDLAGQAVRHFQTYLSEDETRRVLQAYQKPIAINIHAQMHEPGHYWEKVEGYHTEIRSGFTPLKSGAYSASVTDTVLDFRSEPRDRTKIAQLLYGGFVRCLYRTQRFQADTERRLAIIVDRDSQRWFKPLKGQFLIDYRRGTDMAQYVPDFVAETADAIWMLESKARNELETTEVAAKRAAAEEWCKHASAHAATYSGKRWKYALIPHDVVDENMALEFLVRAGLTA